MTQYCDYKISIGLFVRNEEGCISKAIESFLNQSFTDFELIISDNASTDATSEICKKYAALDSRINYIRQDINIGAYKNIKYVLEQARCEYFTWAAADDARTKDYLEINYNFLQKNPRYIASTSPNIIGDVAGENASIIDFSITGDKYDRIKQFFEHCWSSHAIFYALYRTHVLRGCDVVGESFFAADWAINLCAISKGEINRTKSGMMIFGDKGVSNRKGSYKAFRKSHIEMFIPFYQLSKYIYSVLYDLTLTQRIYILYKLVALNISTLFRKVKSIFYHAIFAS